MADEENTATRYLDNLMTDEEDSDIILQTLDKSRDVQSKIKRKWLEFECQKGVHYGKWATYENGERTRIKGGYVGRFDKVLELGAYGQKRIREYVASNHKCKHPERLIQDLEECGVRGIAVEGWPSLSGSERLSVQGRTRSNTER